MVKVERQGLLMQQEQVKYPEDEGSQFWHVSHQQEARGVQSTLHSKQNQVLCCRNNARSFFLILHAASVVSKFVINSFYHTLYELSCLYICNPEVSGLGQGFWTIALDDIRKDGKTQDKKTKQKQLSDCCTLNIFTVAFFLLQSVESGHPVC